MLDNKLKDNEILEEVNAEKILVVAEETSDETENVSINAEDKIVEEIKEPKKSKIAKLWDNAKDKILEMDDIIQIKNEQELQEDGKENTYITIRINSKLAKMFTAKKVGELLDKKQQLQKRARRFTTMFYLITMIGYLTLTFSIVYKNWDDARFPMVLTVLLGLYVLGFLVVIFLNYRMTKNDKASDSDKKTRRIKNYRSLSVIMKKLMSIFSLVVAWMVAIETWGSGALVRTITISFIIISLLITVAGIVLNIRAIKKRSKQKNLSAIARAEKSLRQFADNNKD